MISRLMIWYADNSGNLARTSAAPGHDRGGKNGASQNQQRNYRAVNRIDQPSSQGGSAVPGAEAHWGHDTHLLSGWPLASTIDHPGRSRGTTVSPPHGDRVPSACGSSVAKGSKIGFCLQSLLLPSPAAATIDASLSTVA